MKRFRFPLRPVAVLRAHHEMRAREAFAVSVQELARAEQTRDAARSRQAAMEAALTSGRSGTFSATAEFHALAAYQRECAAVVQAEKAVLTAQDAMSSRRQDYIEAHRRVEVVRRLEDKARGLHRLETMREEQAEYDDFASRRCGGRGLPTR